MVKNPTIEKIAKAFNQMKALVIGDVMTDEYIFGRVERISPEAPVPIVNILKRESRPGGAANVALNIKALGAQAVLCSVAGDDVRGKDFMSMLKDLGIGSAGMLLSDERCTTVKTRVIGNNHQLLRMDEEVSTELSDALRQRFINHCLQTIEIEQPDVIIFEDYDKGVISQQLIHAVTTMAQSKGIPVTVDPKVRNFGNYSHVTLFKPNFSELISGTGQHVDKRDSIALLRVTQEFMHPRGIQLMMVTLSEAGVFITDGKEYHHIAAHIRDISDVSGAGDTVISVASLALAYGLAPRDIASLANLAGGLVCEEVGVVPVSLERFLLEASKIIN